MLQVKISGMSLVFKLIAGVCFVLVLLVSCNKDGGQFICPDGGNAIKKSDQQTTQYMNPFQIQQAFYLGDKLIVQLVRSGTSCPSKCNLSESFEFEFKGNCLRMISHKALQFEPGKPNEEITFRNTFKLQTFLPDSLLVFSNQHARVWLEL